MMIDNTTIRLTSALYVKTVCPQCDIIFEWPFVLIKTICLRKNFRIIKFIINILNCLNANYFGFDEQN